MTKHWIKWIAPVLLTALLLAGGCKKLDLTPGLPDETQEGKNTFGCKVNGKIWLPYTEHTLDRAVEPEYDRGWFAVRVEREKDPSQLMWLQLGDSTGIQQKTYTLNDGFYAYFQSQKEGKVDTYMAGPGSTGIVTITKVEEQPPKNGRISTIVSGTFSFTAKDDISGQTVIVSEGRFDVKAL